MPPFPKWFSWSLPFLHGLKEGKRSPAKILFKEIAFLMNLEASHICSLTGVCDPVISVEMMNLSLFVEYLCILLGIATVWSLSLNSEPKEFYLCLFSNVINMLGKVISEWHWYVLLTIWNKNSLISVLIPHIIINLRWIKD